MDDNTDYIATELLRELKEGNARKDAQIMQLNKNIINIVLGALITIAVIVGGFLVYLNQYDFSSTEEYNYEASGVYALVDSEGNIIAEDLSPEEIKIIMEVLNDDGNGESVDQENQIED